MSIRTRLTLCYSAVVICVLVAGAVSVSMVQVRRGLERTDGELRRLLLTLEGVMRTELGEGLDLAGAAREASLEVVAPDRTLVVAHADGEVLEVERARCHAWGARAVRATPLRCASA